MWIVWLVAVFSVGLITTCVVTLRQDLGAAPRPWRLLASSGIPLAVGGLGFLVRFWEPLPGPYLANEVYPLGPYLNAWAVSFGFMWLAFGLAFFALALRGTTYRSDLVRARRDLASGLVAARDHCHRLCHPRFERAEPAAVRHVGVGVAGLAWFLRQHPDPPSPLWAERGGLRGHRAAAVAAPLG